MMLMLREDHSKKRENDRESERKIRRSSIVTLRHCVVAEQKTRVTRQSSAAHRGNTIDLVKFCVRAVVVTSLLVIGIAKYFQFSRRVLYNQYIH